MGNGGFVYDKTRQEFRKVTHSIWHFVRMGLKYLVLTLTLSILYYVVFSLFISTDTERRLIRENRLYSKLYPSLEEKEKLVGDVVQSLQVRDNAIYTEIFGTGAPSAEGLNPAEILSVADSTRDSDIRADARPEIPAADDPSAGEGFPGPDGGIDRYETEPFPEGPYPAYGAGPALSAGRTGAGHG